MDQIPHLNKIKKAYELEMPRILNEYPHRDTHFYDFYSMMSPIERLVWLDIKYLGLPMYPQFPVLNYVLDFADPVKKIGIEADGKQFHDIKKDWLRDKELETHGWKIYRFKGSQINAVHKTVDGMHPLEYELRIIKQENY